MKERSVLFALSCAVLLGGLAACATEEVATQPSGTKAATPRPSGSTSTGTSSVPKAMDTLGDSVNACLSRIPKDSTAGERMMAENSCRRDEAIRVGNTRSGDQASAGAADDTMQACMARIPKDATAGQRMLAQESCKRDEANRK